MQELEKILEEIELEKKRLVFYPDCSSAFSAAQIRTIEKIEQIICKYMSNCKRMNDGWIPVEEKLPEDEAMMLVTCQTKAGRLSVNRAWYGEGTWHGTGTMSGVIAWRPLPEPYCPERSKK